LTVRDSVDGLSETLAKLIARIRASTASTDASVSNEMVRSAPSAPPLNVPMTSFS
jgi:hypothetical protein